MTTPPAQTRLWSIQTQHKALIRKLAQSLNTPLILAHLLLNRGVTSLDDAINYLSESEPDVTGFPDTWIKTTISIIQSLQASPKKARVLVYGDYDVDGITSTTVMMQLLTQLGFDVTYFIPDRFNDGYGLTDRVYDLVKTRQPDWLITLDCGVSNYTECTYLKAHYPDLKITIIDHHQMPELWPPADSIINPKCLNPSHDYYALCTVGIVYEFFKVVIQHLNPSLSLSNHLDMVALGTIADIASLSPFNRYLVRAGLSTISNTKRIGLQALLSAARLDKQPVSSRDVGFGIAPLLNAAGRLANASLCVNLLTTTDHDEATAIARRLTQLNTDRRSLTAAIMQDAQDYLTDNPTVCEAPVLVVMGRNWHAGVIGIVAARLTDYYHKPSLVIGYDDTGARGSARSIPTINIYSIIRDNSTYLDKFGGHHQAAGFSLSPGAIAGFQTAIIKYAHKHISANDLKPRLAIDCELLPETITRAFWKDIVRLSPFGPDNPEPVFAATFRVIDVKLVGNGNHIKATFSNDARNMSIDGIGFGLADRLPVLQQQQCRVAFTIQTNTWRNITKLQLTMLDVKPV